MKISPLAGKAAPTSMLVDVARLITAYYSDQPDPLLPGQAVVFGTSGHRGSSFDLSFNEWHVLAISQAICDYRVGQGITGPLFLGKDTHALSVPACSSALEVLAANRVEVMLSAGDEYTPTPAISLAIITHNRGRKSAFADGIVITPSHNPPDSGGFKYNPPHGGPANKSITAWIEKRANEYLTNGLNGVRRISAKKSLNADSTHSFDYLSAYVNDLGNIVDMDLIAAEGITLGVDPLGGAGTHYWPRIAEHYKLNLQVVSDDIDPTFRFMSVDWDGKIRMDPSSSYAMERLVNLRKNYDVAFACDPDHDRHAIVSRRAGLIAPNHYFSVVIDYLFRHRPNWSAGAGVGKTIVSTAMIDRVCARLGRRVYEVPVGFKWFCDGLSDGTLGFCGEESAGASFLRMNGTVWTTDKDGLAPALLSAEITVRSGRDIADIYRGLTSELGDIFAKKIETPATAGQKQALSGISPQQLHSKKLAGEPIRRVLVNAPGNNSGIEGVKVISDGGWFAARPSGTESTYKIYAESFRGEGHLQDILKDAQEIVDAAIAANTDLTAA